MRRWLYISAMMWMLAGSLPVGCMLTGCKGACGGMGTCGGTRQASCGLGDVRRTLAEADSMRMNHGVAYDDSLALAEAYDAFGRYRIVYPDDYARACYYYGRMLRNRCNHVGAMQAFISGTHAPYVQRVVPLPWFSNHAILGRIYSNMGTMCHRKNEFVLSYQMYKQSSAQFLQAGDTISYFYALNAMALQLAEQKKHDETLVLLNDIEDNCSYSAVLNKIWETKAILYFNLAQYDSTIYSVKQLQARGNHESTGYVKEAQAFWELHQYDSAVYYARIVLEHPAASEPDRYNMLYILSNNHSENNIKHVQELSSARADINDEKINPQLQDLSVAIELLRQDMNITPWKKWLISIMLALVFVIPVIIVVYNRHKSLLQRESNFDERVHETLQREQIISDKIQHLQTQEKCQREKQLREIEYQCERLRSAKNLKRALHLSDYAAMKKTVDMKFNMLVDKLEKLENLSQRDIQFCILVLLNVPQKQIADVLVYSSNSIKGTKTYISNKMKTSSSELRNRLIDIILQ